jgi:hypothetical protein
MNFDLKQLEQALSKASKCAGVVLFDSTWWHLSFKQRIHAMYKNGAQFLEGQNEGDSSGLMPCIKTTVQF